MKKQNKHNKNNKFMFKFNNLMNLKELKNFNQTKFKNTKPNYNTKNEKVIF